MRHFLLVSATFLLGYYSSEIYKLVLKLFKLYRPRREIPLYVHQGVDDLIGNTPLIELKCLSELTGCRILAKAEFLNPGGSTKDRVALRIIQDAEARGLLKKNGNKKSTIFEGTVGSTGISLAMLCCAKGYHCTIFMPDDVAKEKSDYLIALGANVQRVRPVSIIDENMYVNLAKKKALELGEYGFFADQFENESNFNCHYQGTGPEIWEQTGGNLDAFVMGAGTGGTLAGVSRFLKEKNSNIKVYLSDPPGSGLHNKVQFNIMFAPEEAEGTRHRHQVDTIVEGVGINRITRNFTNAIVDHSFKIPDHDTVAMSRLLMKKEGLFVGSSSSINCVAACLAAKELGKGHTIVTLLCDSGSRHMTKFWSDETVANLGIDYTKSIYYELANKEC